MNLDELYDQILNSKKQKNSIINQTTQVPEQSKVLEDFYDLNNYSVFTEINIFSKFHLEW